jgi:thymidylate synthase (FAD)
MSNHEQRRVLDHGYVKLIETWGRGEARVPEAGIIEAARQSTQASFRSWAPYQLCKVCSGWRLDPVLHPEERTAVWNDPATCEVHQWQDFPRGDEGLLAFLFNNKPPHATPFEFAGMTIEVQCPIFVIREWHRHRTQGYNEMSARYAPLPDINYIPSLDRLFRTQARNKQAQPVAGAVELTGDAAQLWLAALEDVYAHAQAVYQLGLDIGVPKEVARLPVPVGRYTRMRATTNLRNWLGFLTLRSHPDAQEEIRMFANTVGTVIQEEFPRTWNLFDLARRSQ